MPTVRTARGDELDDLLELYGMLNPEEAPLERTERVREQWERLRADDSVVVVVVEHGDRPVATCVLSVTPNLTRGARPWAVIENVVTHEAHRGEGFGSLCLEGAVEMARERDCYKVMLLTGTDREWKRRFYETCGFDREAKTGFVKDLRG
ncbi:MAG: GNAT family N-acetyltransferase [Haloarculaceae archaeon]